MKKVNFLDINLHKKLTLWPDNAYFTPMFDHIDQANLGLIKIAPLQQQQKHFHKQGADIFIVTEGEGVLYLGDVCEKSGQLSNESAISVTAGDVYFIAPFQMHSLENTSKTNDLMFLNIAPASHGDTDSFAIE